MRGVRVAEVPLDLELGARGRARCAEEVPGRACPATSREVGSPHDGSSLVIVGRFRLFYNFAVPLKRALDDTRVLTQAADGNVAVISYLRATQTSTEAVVGLVLKAPAGTTESKNLKPGKMNEI